MHATTLTVATPDGPMGLFEATPDGEIRGAVVVIQEAFGVNDHIRDVAARFAAEGYLAVAPAMFHRNGGGTVEYGDMPTVMGKFSGLTIDGVADDLAATFGFLADQGHGLESISIVGFCWGGWVAFLAAARYALRAAVSFYPGGLVEPSPLGFPPLVDAAESLKTPWLGLFGNEDSSIPADQIDRLVERLKAAPVQTKVLRYDGVGHAFHCDARPNLYNEAAAKDGWGNALKWLDGRAGE
jgi:carboxymethylenebutenolidase